MNSNKSSRREHYVPRFYLGLFSDSLYVFDKLNNNVFATTSGNIAFEKGFYDLDPKIDLEGVIAENEARMSNAIYELVDKKNPISISKEARIRISLFITLQFVRTREFRATLQQAGGELMTEIMKNEPDLKNLDFKIVMKDELAQALQAQMIVSDVVPRTAWMLGNSRWILLVNRTKAPFWTSDNPVVLYNPMDNISEDGLAVRGIQTHFPLNNNLLLIILDPTSYDQPAIKIVKNLGEVVYENALQLYNATRFVYSSTNDFSIVKKISEQDETLLKTHERVILRKKVTAGRSIIHLRKEMTSA